MIRWYVVRSHAKAEHKARWHLCRQGFDAYLPLYRRHRRHARRVDWVKAPLFPRYLFVGMDPGRSRWRAINSTIGVSHLICGGDGPVPVPHGVVEEIRLHEGNDGLIRMASQRPFKRGEAVRINCGALADRVGLFAGQTDEERVILLLELLGRQVEVKVPLGAVAACV